MYFDTKKIIELIKNDKNIAEKLFLFSSWVNSKKDTLLFITNKNKDLIKGTEWIYKWKEKFLNRLIYNKNNYKGCI